MTDIHAVIAELKALEASETITMYIGCLSLGYEGHLRGKSVSNALPHLLAYIEKLEAVASAADAVIVDQCGSIFHECECPHLNALAESLIAATCPD